MHSSPAALKFLFNFGMCSSRILFEFLRSKFDLRLAAVFFGLRGTPLTPNSSSRDSLAYFQGKQ
ncbi:hypothetical protein PGT21_003899 [Puccinia graminis f. sp. tritici]|uniref:Uncharacterized protein n=1 Tax=Puccinia graminis f. sp. tritici TaxID=56615 RepID=A0A5B0SD21_PUCGR|nr:hypothetical protein PGT21_003899 [Puccinia graminis f. sp. tritici]KAA1134294.1 hypothetical protein PGTUg99_034788 [Puccinia graminis f. sp. tritici]